MLPAGCYEVTVGGGSYDYEISFTLGDILVDQPSGTYSDLGTYTDIALVVDSTVTRRWFMSASCECFILGRHEFSWSAKHD